MSGAERYVKEHIIIGEGDADKRFFEVLTQHRGCTEYQVANPAGGASHFVDRLEGLKASPDFGQLSLVVLVRDCDDDPKAAFNDTCRQIAQAGYLAPAESLNPGGKREGWPAVAVILLPWIDEPGCLETLIYEVMKDEYPAVAAGVESLLDQVPTKDCDVSKRSKARVACMIASVCKDDPGCSVAFMWYSERRFLPLLAKPQFNRIADHLQQLCGDGGQGTSALAQTL